MQDMGKRKFWHFVNINNLNMFICILNNSNKNNGNKLLFTKW